MNYSKTAAFLLLLTLLAANFSFAQTAAAQQPSKQEKLLNGLKVLIWNEPKSEKVSLRLRIHSGSAFDPKDKMGTMALVADILFPDEQTKSFFAEDLEGSLEVTSNYDYIQINATAKTDEFLTILETIATAVSNPPITQENFVKVRDARLKTVEEMQKNPVYVADTTVSKRLLGDFPYGRPQGGAPESLKLIERADLLAARDRFLTADNATLAITGSVKPDFAFMAARRLFGAWKKSDKLVPATFRQPDAPDASLLTLASPAIETTEIRYATRGLARNDRDFVVSSILTKILNDRLSKEIPKDRPAGKAFARQNSNLLPGLIVVGLSNFPVDMKAQQSENPPRAHMIIFKEENLIASLLSGKISGEEFEKARKEVVAEINQTNFADSWLDVDTYKLASVKDEMQRASGVTIAEAQQLADKFQKQPFVRILMTKPGETNPATNN
ncbi:MAG TPA: pitrilysin family protein [Pyrinomonadaceae bacterium]|nr:pitrilysin family protein [Pyrinomonadaceae bacterium]